MFPRAQRSSNPKRTRRAFLKRRSSHAFTLLELLLVVMLLGMLGSLLGVQMMAMLRTRQFLASATSLYEMVKVGQMVAIGHETEVELRWSLEDDLWVARLFCESDIALLSGYRSTPLKGFTSLSLADSIENRVIITNTGSFLPRAILRLEGPGEQQRYLDLRTPLPFTLSATLLER